MILFRRRIEPVLGALVALTLVTSVAAAIDGRRGGDLYERLALVPARVWSGELWRLVTWIFVELSPLALCFTCLTIYWFGGELLETWGRRRFARIGGAVVLAAAIGTSALAYAFGTSRVPYFGGWAIGDALAIAWGLQFPTRLIRIWRVIVVPGETFAWGTYGFTILCALFWGVGFALPAVIAGTVAVAIMTGALPGMRRRLRVMRGGKHEPPHGPYYTN